MHQRELRLLSSRTERRSRLTLELDGVARRLAAATTSEQIIRILVDRVATASGAICSVLYVLEPERGRLEMARAWGLTPSMTSRLAHLPLSSSFPPVTAVRKGRALWFRNRASLLADYPDFYSKLPHNEIQSVAALPLKLGDWVLGAFATAYSDEHVFADDDLEFLLLAMDLAARALARCVRQAPPVPRQVSKHAVSFQPTDGPRPSPFRPTSRVDLARLVRLVCRRHLTAMRQTGRNLFCEAGEGLVGYWDRRWAERMVDGMLSMALDLIPAVDTSLDARREGDEAVVEVRYAKPQRSERPSRPSAPVDLARMTAAREEWAMGLWLWRGMAHAQGARLVLLRGKRGPDGLRLTFPLRPTSNGGHLTNR